MKLIQNISSTLKTWVFKNKVFKFSKRYRRDPQACFYCPEMCRFSCPTAETLRTNAITPRGKMSLLHLTERGYSDENVAGDSVSRQWFLEQCTGCGRCTEYCVHEVDVASNLREERNKFWQAQNRSGLEGSFQGLLRSLEVLSGRVLFCEPGRASWWNKNARLLKDLQVDQAVEVDFPHREWGWGKLQSEKLAEIGKALKKCELIYLESPEVGWFFAKGLKADGKALSAEVRLVWPQFFKLMVGAPLPPGFVFHESFHLTRLLPRLGYSIPMYERGQMPFHSGWNVLDCGGEGFYRHAHLETAKKMATRFLGDLGKDGRKIDKIVCQSLACVEHLRQETSLPVVYWLDEVVDGRQR
ncbi:MAG: (Fe-S)-binding protein [Bdellovibrionota bacterium]